MSAFYLKGASPKHVTLNQIFAGMMPYMLIVILCMVIMYVWPGMTLWLPNICTGGEAQRGVPSACHTKWYRGCHSACNIGSDAYLMTASGIMRHRAIVLREGRFLRDHTFVV